MKSEQSFDSLNGLPLSKQFAVASTLLKPAPRVCSFSISLRRKMIYEENTMYICYIFDIYKGAIPNKTFIMKTNL